VKAEVLMFSDLHIRGSKHRQVLIDSFNWVCEQIVEHSPRLVVMLGDTFHAYTSIEIPDMALAFDAYADFISACEVVGAELIVLVGNHDQYSQDGETHSMGFLGLSHHKLVTVVNREGLPTRQVGAVTCGFLGYVPYKEPPVWTDSVDVLFTHCPILGIDGSFKDSHDWPQEAFAGFSRVFMGHYHDPQHHSAKFVVVGSLTAQSFGDQANPTRGIVLWDGKDTVERVGNPHSPYYSTVNLNKTTVHPGCMELDNIFDAERTHLRIRYDSQYEDDAIALSKEFKWLSVQMAPQAEEQVIERSSISIEMPVEQAVVEYAEQACPEGLDAEKLGAAGVAFVKGAE